MLIIIIKQQIQIQEKKKKKKLAGPFSKLSRFDVVTQYVTQITGVENYPELLQNHTPEDEQGQQTNRFQNSVSPHHESNVFALKWDKIRGNELLFFFSSRLLAAGFYTYNLAEGAKWLDRLITSYASGGFRYS